MEENKHQGIHIHCPDGATNKDGPSAGTAITIVMYSMLTKKKIKHNVAITGEMNLQEKVTAIGGLDLKIIGGIEAGVTEFIYPEENHEDFEKFLIKYEKRKEILDGITFHKVNSIHDVLKLVFV
jgi:ATP-dependent Lon protease